MREAIKVTWVVVLMVGFFVSTLAWLTDWPGGQMWACRLGGAAAAMLALVAFLTMHFRADLVHDYLRDIARSYFNRDGFCFAPCVAAENGIAYMLIYFQNQRDQPCVGRVALRPARGFFMNRAPIGAITYQIECKPRPSACPHITADTETASRQAAIVRCRSLRSLSVRQGKASPFSGRHYHWYRRRL